MDDADILAAFTTMREHLAENAIIAFETRNPAVDWKARWEGDAELRSGDRIIRQSRIVTKKDGRKRIAFGTHYQFPDRTLTSSSELLFLSRREVEDRLRQCALKARTIYGNWDKQPFDEHSSDEMIFIVEAI